MTNTELEKNPNMLWEVYKRNSHRKDRGH